MTTRWVLAGTLLASSVLVTTAARSQEAPRVALEGKKVRLLAAAIVSGHIEGVVLETDQQSLVISQAVGTRLRVPRQTVTRLEVSTGRRRHTLKGMCVGAGLFALLAISSAASTPGDTALAALAGGGWGAGIGTLIGGERWSTIPLDHVSPGPTTSTTPSRLAFTVRF